MSYGAMWRWSVGIKLLVLVLGGITCTTILPPAHAVVMQHRTRTEDPAAVVVDSDILGAFWTHHSSHVTEYADISREHESRSSREGERAAAAAKLIEIQKRQKKIDILLPVLGAAAEREDGDIVREDGEISREYERDMTAIGIDLRSPVLGAAAEGDVVREYGIVSREYGHDTTAIEIDLRLPVLGAAAEAFQTEYGDTWQQFERVRDTTAVEIDIHLSVLGAAAEREDGDVVREYGDVSWEYGNDTTAIEIDLRLPVLGAAAEAFKTEYGDTWQEFERVRDTTAVEIDIHLPVLGTAAEREQDGGIVREYGGVLREYEIDTTAVEIDIHLPVLGAAAEAARGANDFLNAYLGNNEIDLRRVSVCCSAMQCVAVRGSLLQCVAVRCSVMQGVLVCSIPRKQRDCPFAREFVLQGVAVRCSVVQCSAVWCSVLQCVAVCCSVLQCVAVCCSVLQCVAVCSSTLHTSETIRLTCGA